MIAWLAHLPRSAENGKKLQASQVHVFRLAALVTCSSITIDIHCPVKRHRERASMYSLFRVVLDKSRN